MSLRGLDIHSTGTKSMSWPKTAINDFHSNVTTRIRGFIKYEYLKFNRNNPALTNQQLNRAEQQLEAIVTLYDTWKRYNWNNVLVAFRRCCFILRTNTGWRSGLGLSVFKSQWWQHRIVTRIQVLGQHYLRLNLQSFCYKIMLLTRPGNKECDYLI